MKADELRDQGETPTLDLLNSQEFRDEYNTLSREEREEIMNNHQDTTLAHHRKRPTAKARIQDVTVTLKNVRGLLQGLNMRVGVEAFFCVVRNTPDYHMDPIWFFTSKAMMEYMPIAVPFRQAWDLAQVGTKLEAFAIAGCDSINLHRTSKQKADEIKRQIRDKINLMLVEITNNENATMQYVNYEELVVQRYGVELVGWTYEKFVNPSELSTSLPPLRQLLDAINNGDCKFRKLTVAEVKARRQEYQKKVDDGTLPTNTRKPRKDKGTKRKKTGNNAADGDSNKENPDRDEGAPAPKLKRRRQNPKSNETVDGDADAQE
ncbi:hypothetical protein NLJ89_g12016 [Agrocybe chaxingu]|uniref:Uncharacterized protein n=1 Tax=Agrocybe chaxingu TaxID=84603 RepID=A0A9W8JN47_9AGAR|nr:hypothetical protein NLJ89_g12016 [Agrocybe chaxingu]